MAQLIVGMTPALASALARGENTRDTARLLLLTTRAHLDLKPQHARSLDELRTTPSAGGADGADETVWFWAETGPSDQARGPAGDPAGPQADDLGAALLAIPGVTAAYVKPPGGPP